MSARPITLETTSIEDAIGRLSMPWAPIDLATANGSVVRLARLEEEFEWHEHDEDELFLCWDGSFRIELSDGREARLESGDLFVVPKGTRHRPVAERRAHALLFERLETKQYGNR